MTTLTFVIPKPLWMTSNRLIQNRGYKQRIVGDLQDIARAAACDTEPIAGQVYAHWIVRYPKGVRRQGRGVQCPADHEGAS